MIIQKPINASPEVQKAFQDVEDALQRLVGTLNIDMKGRRVINAGNAVADADYITLAQAKKLFQAK